MPELIEYPVPNEPEPCDEQQIIVESELIISKGKTAFATWEVLDKILKSVVSPPALNA